MYRSCCPPFRLCLTRCAGHRLGLWTRLHGFRRGLDLLADLALAYLAGEHLALVHGDVRVEHDRGEVVGDASGNLAGPAEVDRHPNLVINLALNAQRPQPGRHQGAGLDAASPAGDDHPVANLDSTLRRELGTQLDEHRRLQFVEPAVEAAHAAAQIVLGDAIGGSDDWIAGVLGRRESIERYLRYYDRRIVLPLVERVLDDGLNRLVVRRQWPILGPARREEPAFAIRLDDKGRIAGDEVHPLGIWLRSIAWRAVHHEVRSIEAGPLALLGVPPDVALALAPGLTLGIGAGAVVHHASVAGPGPGPVEVHVLVQLAVALVGAVAPLLGINAGIDPAAAGCAAIGLELVIALDLLVIFDGVAVDLL